MTVRELDSTRIGRPPRAMAWVLILASAAAVVAVGLLATLLIFGTVGGWQAPPAGFWPRFAAACGLTLASLGFRSLRWIFLLRRAEARLPLRDAYIGYLAGFSLLLTPLLVGEALLRAIIHRRRCGVPIAVSLIVNVWERALDVVALIAIAAAVSISLGQRDVWTLGVSAVVLLSLMAPVRRLALRMVIGVVDPLVRPFETPSSRDLRRLATSDTWGTALITSVVAWLLPGIGWWLLANTVPNGFGLAEAELSYAQSATLGAVTLAPGGVVVAGRQMLDGLMGLGTPESVAAVVVLGIRLATVGVSTVLGALFVVMHWRTLPASSETHFDDIADAYDVQIPESRRHALLDLKTTLMRDAIGAYGTGRTGLDVGCGQGAYVARMRQLGFAVSGIDASAGQIALAARNVGDASAVRVGSVLDIPAIDDSYDFLYIINVLHHLPSLDDQRRAFAELLRVLKPGGLLFIHEINTRNVLFRFYMGYVFPSLNCIDEGTERWLLPHRFARYTETPVVEVRYFTFLPDFIPQSIARLLRPFERALERSRLACYSAHYMAVLRKPSGQA